MSSVQTVSTSLLSAVNGTGGSGSASTTQDTQDQFLKLLVTQMKNQDPLNPMDNAQVTSQMAQLSTVTGIEKLNTTLQTMSAAFSASQSLQASGMIGRSVLAPGSSLVLSSGGTASGGFALEQPVDGVTVTIKNSAGAVVHTASMGAQNAGNVLFQWDGATDSGGTAAPGTYTFEVAATQGGQKVSAQTLSLGSVYAVTLGSQGTTLDADVLGSVDVNKVKQIF
jgi:flagellar basal-body rod modification protein FlgD